MKQYVVTLAETGRSIEHTGYFKTVAAVRKYLKTRYGTHATLLKFQAVYPNVEPKIYTV